MTRFFRQVLVIARRDFSAIVLTPTFLIFLLAPLFMLAVATIGSLGAVRVIEGGGERILVLAPQDEVERFREAERRVRIIATTDAEPPPITYEASRNDRQSLARSLVRQNDVAAVLVSREVGPLIIHKPGAARDAAFLALVAGTALSDVHPQLEAISMPVAGGSKRARDATAFGAVFAMFFLTLLLASQAISMLAEERNNKVIEILAAAVPLEAVFFGKLIGMLGVALLFTLFWSGVAVAAVASGLGGLNLGAVVPATGLPVFAALFIGYFVLAFLLLGAVFLGVGAQAGTMREIQMLSLPVTIFQVSMFALASAGASDPDGAVGIAAALFPFSSPFAMAARAASGVPAWQHVAAFAWQLLWLGLTVSIAARLFRRGVLKSGGGRR